MPVTRGVYTSLLLSVSISDAGFLGFRISLQKKTLAISRRTAQLKPKSRSGLHYQCERLKSMFVDM